MSQKIYKGNEIQVFYQDRTLAYATAHTLTITGNTSDIASKDHGEWAASSVTSLSWEVTGEYFHTDYDYDGLFDLMLYKRPVLIKISNVYNYSNKGLIGLGGDVSEWYPSPKCKQGYAVITSLALNANTGEKATYSITFTGSGPLVEMDYSITPYFMDIKYNPEELRDGMQLFNANVGAYINSGWVYSSGGPSIPVQIDISDGTLKDPTPEPEDALFRFYFSGPNVPEMLFRNNSYIDSVSLGENIRVIRPFAFAGSTIRSLSTNVNNMNYMHDCFNDCYLLEGVNNSGGVNYLEADDISARAFAGCVRLGNIHTGDACESVQLGAFQNCVRVSEVHFGPDVYNVGDGAFSVDSHPTPKVFHFYSETAPNIGTLPFGPIGYQTFCLHNSTSEQEFITGRPSWSQYEGATFVIGS